MAIGSGFFATGVSLLSCTISRDSLLASNGAQLNMTVTLHNRPHTHGVVGFEVVVDLHNDGGAAARDVKGITLIVKTNDVDYAEEDFKNTYCLEGLSLPLAQKIPKGQDGPPVSYLMSLEDYAGGTEILNPAAKFDGLSGISYFIMSCARYSVGSFLLVPTIKNMEFLDFYLSGTKPDGSEVFVTRANDRILYKSVSLQSVNGL